MITTFICAAIALHQPASDLNDSIALLDRLDATILSVDYANQPIRAIVDDLNGRLPAQLWADWKALERIGVYGDRRISLRQSAASASTVLSALTLIIGDELEKPVYETHAGQVVLTTLAGSSPFKVTAVYDVRDLLSNEALLKRLRDEVVEQPPPPSDNGGENAGKGEPGDAREPGHAHADGSAPPVPRPLTPGEKLMLFITDHVDPDAWINFGGNRGLITELNGVLMVTATPTTHRRLRSAIRSLKAAIPTTITFEAAIIDVPRSKLQALTRQCGNDVAALAQSLLLDPEATRLWHTTDPVAINHPLSIESSGADQSVNLSLSPTFDPATGMLRVAIDASVVQGEDSRTVKTVAALGSDFPAASFELPSSKPVTMIRLVVLVAQRR